MALKKRKSGPSGPTLPESRRHELGQRRLQLRIPAAQLERLDQLCKRSGLQRSEQVGVLIDEAADKPREGGE